ARLRIPRRTGDAQAGAAARAATRAEKAASQCAASAEAGGPERRWPAPGLRSEGAPDQGLSEAHTRPADLFGEIGWLPRARRTSSPRRGDWGERVAHYNGSARSPGLTPGLSHCVEGGVQAFCLLGEHVGLFPLARRRLQG